MESQWIFFFFCETYEVKFDLIFSRHVWKNMPYGTVVKSTLQMQLVFIERRPCVLAALVQERRRYVSVFRSLLLPIVSDFMVLQLKEGVERMGSWVSAALRCSSLACLFVWVFSKAPRASSKARCWAEHLVIQWFFFPWSCFFVVVVVCAYESHDTDAGLKQAGIDRWAGFTTAPSQFFRAHQCVIGIIRGGKGNSNSAVFRIVQVTEWATGRRRLKEESASSSSSSRLQASLNVFQEEEVCLTEGFAREQHQCIL